MTGRTIGRPLLLPLLLLACSGEGGTAASPTPTSAFQGTIFFSKSAFNRIGDGGTIVVDSADLLASTDDGPMVSADPAVFRDIPFEPFLTFTASQDGRRGAFEDFNDVVTVDLTMRPFRYDTIEAARSSFPRPEIAPDGEHVLAWDKGPDERVTVTRFDGSLPRILAQSQGGPRITSLQWAGPDRIVIVRVRITGGGDTTLTRFVHAEEHRISTGVVRDLGLTDSVIGLNTPDFFPSRVAFNADGTRALWVNNSSDVTPETRTTRVTLADSNLRVLQTFEVPHDVGRPVFSPDGKRAIFSVNVRGAAPCDPTCLLFVDIDTGQQTLHTTPREFGRLIPRAWTSRPLPPAAVP